MSKINLHNYEAFLIDYLDGNLSETAIAELKALILANPQLDIDLNNLDLPVFTSDDTKIDFKNDLKKQDTFNEDEELINYLENNLPEVARKAFELMLLSNKDLAKRLSTYQKTVLSFDESLSIAKTTLYKIEDDLILSNTALAYTEDQLSIADKLSFEKELKTNMILQKELASFQKVKLQVDNTIVFSDKEALKKETKVIALFSFRTVASLAAAILLLIGLAFVFNYYNAKPKTEIKEIAKNNFNKILNNTENQLIKPVDSSDKLNNNIPENVNFIAKKTNNTVNNNSINKDQQNELKEPQTNSVAINKEEKDPFINNNQLGNEPKEFIVKNNSVIDTTHTAIAFTNRNETRSSKQNYLIAVEESDDEDALPVTPAKKGFWQRAVKLAKQVNKLGVKAIDGEETQNKNYSLSFNSFSVERR
ncbi:MAG: hypothetical protein ABIP51_03570 [Bacteroidia bacterium]